MLSFDPRGHKPRVTKVPGEDDTYRVPFPDQGMTQPRGPNGKSQRVPASGSATVRVHAGPPLELEVIRFTAPENRQAGASDEDYKDYAKARVREYLETAGLIESV